MSDFRVRVSVKNALMLSAIETAGYECGQKLSEKIGIRYGWLNAYVALKRSPINLDGSIRSCALKICDFFNKSPIELWSPDQIVPLKNNYSDLDLNMEDMTLLSGVFSSYAINGPEKAILSQQKLEKIHAMIKCLPERLGKILTLRYGLDGDEPKTSKETGEILKITGCRVLQLEETALRFLRRDTRPEGMLALEANNLFSGD